MFKQLGNKNIRKEEINHEHPSVYVNNTGELGYDGPQYDRFLHMTDDMLGPSPMHIKYS